MSRKAKYTVDQKIKACEKYLSGCASAKELAQELGMKKNGCNKIREWARMYKTNGQSIFLSKEKNASYTKEFKMTVVNEYNQGNSLINIASKYGIPSNETVRKWIIKYNRHEELEDYTPQPEVYSMSARKTTKEERIQIVNWCLENNKNYKKAAATFECSYTQVYQWVKKYLSDGEDALDDKRGKKKPEEELSDTEKLNRKIVTLQKQNEKLERENALLKKLNALDWK